MHIEIKKATQAEVQKLQIIARTTFQDTFSSYNSEENMTEYLEKELTLSKLESQLSDPHSQFYFALFTDAVAGYLKINTGSAQTEVLTGTSLEIERIYVLKDFQGKNIGQQLYGKAMEIAKEMDADYVWLGVWEENEKAISFYEKNGFKAFDQHVFKLGDDEQTDILMKLDLKY